jgi:phage-related protein
MSTKLAIDDYDMSQLGMYIGTPNQGFWSGDLILDSEVTHKEVPYLDGAIFVTKKFKPRILEIPCYIDQVTEVNKRTILQKINSKTESKFTFDGIPYMYIYGVPYGKNDINFVELPSSGSSLYSGHFIFKIFCAYPFFKSTFTSLDEGLDSYEDIPPFGEFWYNAGLPYFEDILPASFSSVTTNLSFDLENYGNANAKTLITLDGSGTNVVLTNTTSGETFTISVLSSEDIVVDGNKGQVRDVADSALKTNLFSGNFIEMLPGTNSWTVTADSINLTTISILFRHTFY